MTKTQSDQNTLSRVLDVLIAILRTDITTLIIKIAPLVRQWFNRAEGIYEVLDFDAQLELCDPKGKQAIYTKREQVRFLQDNVIAIQDQAWGEGDTLADYTCSPGIAVDRYQEGYRYRILISLRQTKNRGDIETFHIERHIRDGFTKTDGYFQTNVDHRMRKLALRVIFPAQRTPSELFLVEQHAQRTTLLVTHRMPNGDWMVEWSKEKPKQFESYIFRWKW